MRPVNQSFTSYFGEPSIGAWMSDTHLAAAFQEPNCIRLDICRRDMVDGITWDELQAIKHACGFGGKDALECYPADKDVLNTANYRHLYIVDEPLVFIRRNHA